MKTLFWLCLGLIAYTYLIYPGLIFLLARLFPRPIKEKSDITPPVVMLIAAYNEEDVLLEKIENCLALDYPRDKIRFIFGSDGSTDATNQILFSQTHPQIQSELFPTREGKSSVLNKLVSMVNEEIIILSDANTIYHPEAVKKMIRHFSDPDIGGVCGKLSLQNESGAPGGEGEGLYWRYENMIKKAEGTLNSVISANGAIFAIRKELFSPLPIEVIVNDDFSITLMVLQKKFRVVYEPTAIAVEKASPNMKGEFLRKIRISSLNFNSLPEMIPLMHPRYGFTALAIFSHKILRWMVPLFDFGLLISNFILLREGGIFTVLLMGQGVIYLGALLGFLGDKIFDNAGPFIPFYYLAMINIALVIGFWRSLTKTQKRAWDRVQH
jgi:biofilm PGA synthesis N-glycosyltransferase PgaC